MQQFIEKYGEQIQGVVSGFDRLVLRGSVRRLNYGYWRSRTRGVGLPEEWRNTAGKTRFCLRTTRIASCAGINRHVVGNERVLQERRKRIHLGPESCGGHRERSVEA